MIGKSYECYIGIDTGKNTGVAVWIPEYQILELDTTAIHRAFDIVKSRLSYGRILVRVEDARKRSDASTKSRAKAQGAGSVKRDAKIWEDFLTDLHKEFPHLDFEMVSPKQNRTKVSEEQFVKITGYIKRCSEHARDAAMLVYGYGSDKAKVEDFKL